MNRELWKIFFSCALGAGIGAIIALEVAKMFWWVGPIIGGLIGYLSYEWRSILRSATEAYRAVSGRKLSYSTILDLKIVGYRVLHSVFISASFITIFIIFIELIDGKGGEQRLSIVEKSAWHMLLFILTALLIFLCMPYDHIPDDNAPHPLKQQRLKEVKELALFFLPVFLFWHLPRGIVWLIAKGIPKGIVAIAHGIVVFAYFICRFIWKLFLLIHSEKRLICGVDAMIGAMIGYFAGSALIGTMAGGAFGLINYKVITEWWLCSKGYLSAR